RRHALGSGVYLQDQGRCRSQAGRDPKAGDGDPARGGYDRRAEGRLEPPDAAGPAAKADGGLQFTARTRTGGSAADRRNRGSADAAAAADRRPLERAARRHGRQRSGSGGHRRRRQMIRLWKKSRPTDVESAAKQRSIVMDGARKSTGGRTRNRVLMSVAVFFGLYAAIGGRLVYLGLQ